MEKYFKFLFFALLVIIPINVLAESKNSNEIITGTYQFSAIEGNNKQLQNTFVYRDSDFTKSSFEGSKSLEVLSIQVAGASLSWYGNELDKYEIDFSQNDYNIKDFLNKMKFSNVQSNNYYNSEKKENSVGVVIGSKTIIQDEKSYTLLAIIPRSAGYKQEWAGNFTVGDGNLHDGFKNARDEILRFTKKYLEDNNIKGDLKVWTVGYSRGAAISNMVGGFFAGGGIEYFGDDVSITPEDVYCYTIGTPSSVKNGISKNDELSVSENRLTSDYVNDTSGEAFNYTKGGTLSVSDSVYNGIRNIISFDDAFSLLPLEQWGFTRYGKTIETYEGLYSVEEALKELKSISEYVYNEYTENGNRKEFSEKTFDLKTLSIVDKETSALQIDFVKNRLNGLFSKIGTNKIYNDEYEAALKSLLGTYGMVATLTGDIIDSNLVDTSEMVYPLIYSYLAYVSDELQNEGRANSEIEAITIVVEDLLTYYTGTEIDKETFTIDDFVKLVLKYIADNENEPVSKAAISGIISLVPEQLKSFLSSFNIFAKNDNPTYEESIKAFIKACYYGSDPESEAYSLYKEPEQARQLLYLTMLISQGDKLPELQFLMMNQEGVLDGSGKFEDFVGLLIEKVKTEKDDDGNVVKTYSNMGELADEKLKDLLDNLLLDAIEKSEELYGNDYKSDLQNQFYNLKQNITKAREFLCNLFFFTEGGYNIGKSIDNTITLISNASLIAMPHFDEIYLALSRTSNRYDDEYDCIKGNNQTIDLTNDSDLSLSFNFDYYLFEESGKVFVDGKEITKDEYVISKGSTIISINNSYLSTLQSGEHIVTAKLGEKSAESYFNISNINNDYNGNNPQTSDNIMLYVLMLEESMLGLVGTIICNKKYS